MVGAPIAHAGIPAAVTQLAPSRRCPTPPLVSPPAVSDLGVHA